MSFQQLHITEKYIRSVVSEAKKLYDSKHDRLVYCDLWIGRNLITDPDAFYKKYFEEDK